MRSSASAKARCVYETVFLPSVGQVLAIVGAAGIVLTGGRGKEGNVFKKLIGGLGLSLIHI